MKTTLHHLGLCAVIVWCMGISTESLAAPPKWPKTHKGMKIFSYPEDQVVPTNGVATFTVVAEPARLVNPQPLFFEWRKNGSSIFATSNIFGVTSPTLLISNVQLSDVAFYTVVVRRGSTNGPAITVLGAERDAPGARLFVYTGTNTAITGPYQPGTGTKSCIGAYWGKVTFKVPGTQSTWFARPTGTTQCTITDTTALPYPYSAKVQVVDSALWSTCGVHTISFPTQAPPKKYQFTTYVTSGPPPSNTTLTLDIQWLP